MQNVYNAIEIKNKLRMMFENRINEAVMNAIRTLNINGDINIVPTAEPMIQDNTADLEKLKAKQKKPEPKPELETRRFDFIKLFDKGNATPAELNAALKSFIAYIIYDRPNDNITLFLNP